MSDVEIRWQSSNHQNEMLFRESNQNFHACHSQVWCSSPHWSAWSTWRTVPPSWRHWHWVCWIASAFATSMACRTRRPELGFPPKRPSHWPSQPLVKFFQVLYLHDRCCHVVGSPHAVHARRFGRLWSMIWCPRLFCSPCVWCLAENLGFRSFCLTWASTNQRFFRAEFLKKTGLAFLCFGGLWEHGLRWMWLIYTRMSLTIVARKPRWLPSSRMKLNFAKKHTKLRTPSFHPNEQPKP